MHAALLAAGQLQWIVWPLLAVVFGLGLLATFSPGHFQTVAARGGRWVDIDKLVQLLDKPIDVDRHVLRYSRPFGVLVTAAALWLAYVYWTFAN